MALDQDIINLLSKRLTTNDNLTTSLGKLSVLDNINSGIKEAKQSIDQLRKDISTNFKTNLPSDKGISSINNRGVISKLDEIKSIIQSERDVLVKYYGDKLKESQFDKEAKKKKISSDKEKPKSILKAADNQADKLNSLLPMLALAIMALKKLYDSIPKPGDYIDAGLEALEKNAIKGLKWAPKIGKIALKAVGMATGVGALKYIPGAIRKLRAPKPVVPPPLPKTAPAGPSKAALEEIEKNKKIVEQAKKDKQAGRELNKELKQQREKNVQETRKLVEEQKRNIEASKKGDLEARGRIQETQKNINKSVEQNKSIRDNIKYVNEELNKADKIIKEGEKKVAEKIGEKVGTEIAGEIAEKTAKKSLLKKIPILGLGVGLYAGYQRFLEGEYKKAGLEVLSGAISNVPLIGTAGSLAIDAGLLASDTYDALQEAKQKPDPEETNSPIDAMRQDLDSQKQEEKMYNEMLQEQMGNGFSMLNSTLRETANVGGNIINNITTPRDDYGMALRRKAGSLNYV